MSWTLPAVNMSYSDSGFHLEIPEFIIEDDGFLAVVGRNGSGKSTYARTLARLSNGEWFYLPQYPEDFLFAENLLRQIEDLLMVVPERQRLLGIMTSLGFDRPEDLLELPFHILSGGELRRIALACAFYLEPRQLILDEPTIGLTGKENLAILDYLNTFLSMKHRLIIVTHDLEFIRAGGSVMALKDGSLGYTGRIDPFLAGESPVARDYGVRFHGQ